MYAHVAGAGTAAGIPTVLAFTGVTGPGFAAISATALLLLVAGIAALRRAHRSR